MGNEIYIEYGNYYFSMRASGWLTAPRLKLTFHNGDESISMYFDNDELRKNDLMGLLKALEIKAQNAQEVLRDSREAFASTSASPSPASTACSSPSAGASSTRK